MVKKNLLFAACALMAAGASAETLSPDQALQRLVNDDAARRVRSVAAAPRLVHTAMTPQGTPAVYLFNEAGGNGYMMVSADDVAMPLLGYSDKGAIDASDMPPQLQYWIEEYGRQIEYARSKGATASDMAKAPTVPADWQPIGPLVKTMWDQGTPYNRLCPQYQGRYCATGCVATAMAQVMKYWEYPARGTGSVSFYSNQQIGDLRMDFGEQDLDWDNMLDQYVSGNYSTEQADAVAYLMKVCGYATEMNYGTAMSGAVTALMGPALVEHFGYDSGVNVQVRKQFSCTEWNKMMYEHLRDVGPIIYSANSTTGGHCFVLDGYDTDGYFHFNWGWNGMCDGFYSLNALNPVSQGTGGYYGGYNFSQEAMLGIQPAKGEQGPLQTPNLTAEGWFNIKNSRTVLQFSLEDGNPVMWGNTFMFPVNIIFGFSIEAADGREMEPQYIDCTSTSTLVLYPGQLLNAVGFTPMGRIPTSLPDGKYKVSFLIRNASGDPEWRSPILNYGNLNYAYFTKEGNTISLESNPYNQLKITNAEIVTDLYYSNPCKIRLTVVNDSDYELSQTVIPRLFRNGELQYECESRMVTVDPHQTLTADYTFSFSRVTGAVIPTVTTPQEFDFDIYNHETGKAYGEFGKVTMRRNSTSSKLRLGNFSIANAVEEEQTNDYGFVYGIDNFSAIKLTGNFSVDTGFAASPIIFVVSQLGTSASEVEHTVVEQQMPEVVFVSADSPQPLDYTIRLSDVSPAHVYQVECFCIANNARSLLATIRFGASSGVDSIDDPDNVSLTIADDVISANGLGTVRLSVYGLDGSLIAHAEGDGNATIDRTSIDKGAYIATMSDAHGNSRVVKFVR